MSETNLTIINRALRLLGTTPIANLTTDCSDRAQVMTSIYEPTVTTALRSHRWNFAQVRKTLSGFICNPVFGFNCNYLLPENVLTVEETSLDEAEPWRVEQFVCDFNNSCGKVFVTDWTCAPSIVYTAYITDPTKWDPMFTQALVVELAYQASYALTSSQSRVDGLARERDRAWRAAKSRDGQEGRPLNRFLSTVLTRVRSRGGSWRDPSRLN